MRLIKKEETWYRKKYNILGVKVSFKKKPPSMMSINMSSKTILKSK